MKLFMPFIPPHFKLMLTVNLLKSSLGTITLFAISQNDMNNMWLSYISSHWPDILWNYWPFLARAEGHIAVTSDKLPVTYHLELNFCVLGR